MGWGGVGWDGRGMGWDGMEWERDGMGWERGMGEGWDGMGWNGMGEGWDGMGEGWDGMGEGLDWPQTTSQASTMISISLSSKGCLRKKNHSEFRHTVHSFQQK